MADNSNTIAGWVLGAGIVALGGSILAGGLFHAEVPETFGYAVEEEAGPGDAVAAIPMATLYASADIAKGENIFKKCVACHTIAPGGANGIGPNLHGIMGAKHSAVAGFGYSDALKSIPGAWTWEAMNDWIKSPKKYAPGTKMTFAGISKDDDRAALLVYMNAQGSSLPLPPVPVAAEATPEAAGELSEEASPVPENGDVVEATVATETPET